MKKEGEKTPVSSRALMARINHLLACENKKICVTRSDRDRYIYGAYHVVDTCRNETIDYVRDLECYARELGAMADWEEMVGE
ncbi:MAG: hypothetical protein ABSC08_07855 [Bryobacteraceae bacterium]|jgi:hypothetical protein